MKLKLFLYLIFFALTSLSQPKNSFFNEINCLSDIEYHIDRETTLIFDIGDTIISSSNSLIETDSPLTLSSYKSKVELMLSLTLRDILEVDSTLAQLASHGIFFTSLGQPFSGEKYIINQGVCFSFCASKGKILTDIINDLSLNVKKVVFVDDQKFNLLSVYSSMKKLDIPVNCLLYKRKEGH